MESAENKRIEFFKSKIKNRIIELRPYMSDVKYRLYMSIIEDCKSFDEIREMAEMDMQFNMIKYLNEINDKIKLSDTSINELEVVVNQNNRAAKLTVISPRKIEQKPILDTTTIEEDIEDEETLDAAANILMMRLMTEGQSAKTIEETFEEDDSDDYDLEEDSLSLEEEDALPSDFFDDEEDSDSDSEDTDTYSEEEEEDALPSDFFDDDEEENEIEDSFQDDEDALPSDFFDDEEEEDSDSYLDDYEEDDEDALPSNFFDGEEEDSDLDDYEEDNEDALPSDFFDDEDPSDEQPIDFGSMEKPIKIKNELYSEDKNNDLAIEEDENNIDRLFGDDEDDMLPEEDEEEDDLDNLFGDDEDDMLPEDTEDDEEDIDDLFGDSQEDSMPDFFELDGDEDGIEDDEEDSADIMSLFGEEDELMMDEDDFDDTEEDEEPNMEDLFDDSDEDDEPEELNPDDLFGDDEDTDEEEEEPNVEDLFGGDEEDDMFDIDESEFEDDEPDNDSSGLDDLFGGNNTDKQVVNQTPPIKREKTQDKIFINGTTRGKQTQDMFNLINGFFKFTGKTVNSMSKRIQQNARH